MNLGYILFVCWGVECLPMAKETRVQSQVESYLRLKKWYLVPPCLTLSIIRYGSKLGGAIQGKELCPTLHLGVVVNEKGDFWLPLTTVTNFTLYIYIYIYSSSSVMINSLLLSTTYICLTVPLKMWTTRLLAQVILFIVVNAFLGWADNRRMVQQHAQDSLNHISHLLNSEFFLLLD